MKLRIAVLTLALLAVATSAACATAPHLGTPEVITSFSGESDITGSSSTAGHGDAYVVFHRVIGRNIYSVVHRDDHGHAHAFDIPTPSGTYPQAIRLVALEAGGGMAIWDETVTQSVLERSWTADGRLGPVHPVMSHVQTYDNAGFGGPRWRVRADGAGTVVVATTGLPPTDLAKVIATVRDPGGRFSPEQELSRPIPLALDQLAISPIAADGTVAISWAPESGGAAGTRAIRNGRATTFGAPAPWPFTPEIGLTATNRTILADDGSGITISERVARLCLCIRPRVFSWNGGVRVLAFQHADRTTGESGGWYIARAGADGVFDGAVKATTNASSVPVRRARAGEIGFARFDTNTDNNLFRRHSRLVVVPFGTHVARSRRAPRLGFGTSSRLHGAHHLLVPVYCDRVCTVHGSAGAIGLLPITDFLGHRVDAVLEPFSVRYVRIVLAAGQKTVQASATARDDSGHRSSVQATFVRSKHLGVWCLSGASSC